jgi:inner membrane protein
MSQSQLFAKVAILFVMTTLFTVPFLAIGLILGEREQYRAQAIKEVAESTAGSQTVVGPLLVVPYRERHVTRTTDSRTGKVTTVENVSTAEAVLLPDSLNIASKVGVETRSRGIYKARILNSDVRMTGNFQLSPRFGVSSEHDVVGFDPAYLAVMVSDPRGMRRVPVVSWNGTPATPSPGSRLKWPSPGFATDLGALEPSSSRVPFAIDLTLLGTQELKLVPMGMDTRVTMTSSWPHPQFSGRFLPDTRTVSDRGFEASWRLSRFATNIEAAVDRQQRGDEGGILASTFGVGFLEPVDVYRQSERAIKYGILFVVLTFVTFFMFEIVKRLSLHPMQYALVGAALAIFFLLLISISEHLPFAVGYGLSSAACVGLIGYYVSHVLRSGRLGLALAGAVAFLYGLLYVVLLSEDYALLLGSLVLFGVLAAIMVVTRRIDWGRLGEKAAA